MCRCSRVAIFCLLLVLLVPVFAQEDSEAVALDETNPCSAGSILQRIDGSYAEFEATRSAEDSLAAFNDVQNLYESLGAVLEECRNVVELAASGVIEVGSGTFDDPYAFDYFGDTGKGYLLKISGIIRPADQYIGRYATRPSQGREYIALVVDVQCVSPAADFCEVRYSDFELTGDNGVVYDYSSTSSLDVKLRAGGEDNGSVFFIIDSDDSNFLVMYEEGWSDDIVVYRGEPAAGQEFEGLGGKVTITATTSINVRGGPGTSYGVVGSFQTGEEETAVGRNSAGTWVQMERGWVFAQLVRVDGILTSLPVTG